MGMGRCVVCGVAGRGSAAGGDAGFMLQGRVVGQVVGG